MMYFSNEQIVTDLYSRVYFLALCAAGLQSSIRGVRHEVRPLMRTSF